MTKINIKNGPDSDTVLNAGDFFQILSNHYMICELETKKGSKYFVVCVQDGRIVLAFDHAPTVGQINENISMCPVKLANKVDIIVY